MSDCLFCRIVSGEIPADKVLETERTLVFRDLNPKAPHHLLAIPKQHISTINDVESGDIECMGELFMAARQTAEQLGFADDGYRTVMNCGAHAGQTVFHVHLHILAGRSFSWPPG